MLVCWWAGQFSVGAGGGGEIFKLQGKEKNPPQAPGMRSPDGSCLLFLPVVGPFTNDRRQIWTSIGASKKCPMLNGRLSCRKTVATILYFFTAFFLSFFYRTRDWPGVGLPLDGSTPRFSASLPHSQTSELLGLEGCYLFAFMTGQSGRLPSYVQVPGHISLPCRSRD